MKYSIRWQIMLLVCSFIVLALMLIFLAMRPILATDCVQRMEQTETAQADRLAGNIAQVMDNSNHLTALMAVYPDLVSLNQDTLQHILAQAVEGQNQFQILSLLDLQGHQLARSQGSLGERSQRRWFQKFITDHRPCISEVYYSGSADEPVVGIVHGVYDNAGLTGIMMSAIATGSLQQIIDKYNEGNKGQVYLIGHDGTLIAHSGYEMADGIYNLFSGTAAVPLVTEAGTFERDGKGDVLCQEKKLSLPVGMDGVIREVLSEGRGVGSYQDAAGHRYICASHQVVFSGIDDEWTLLIVQNENEAFLFLDTVLVKFVWVGTIVLIFVLLLLFYFSRQLTQPISAIANAAESIKNGDLSIRLPIFNNDEIGRMSAAFNQMVISLQEHKEEQALAEAQIREMAYFDSLTGLPNRANLKKFLVEQLSRENGHQQGAILFIDLDDFKSINDNFGHAIGDQVIIAAGQRIRDGVGLNSFVCRLGGDEFIVVLTEMPSHEAVERKVGRVLHNINSKLELPEEDIYMSCSIGIAYFSDEHKSRHSSSIDDLLKKADGAMYAAKQAGRNCWKVYTE